ncbi:ABC transporter permease [Natribacillus halophilus]|uniref:Osmoprotectant transport system permease protein n=1 Tax=Natribacillus halophilus TaxID=549003 RepID=A0A1G8SF17_9BACI|nr:ABC transporter permease [Natribacillus halophilus]SDJ27829.1 osmoprotectant transport system permease protein [Natribacillus halophilus]
MNTVIEFLQTNGGEMLALTGQHLFITLGALFLGILFAVPLGVILNKVPSKLGNFVIGIVSILQTFPSLAILAFAIPILGVGMFPAIVALFVYSLLPMLRNTYVGISGVDPALNESGKGMGMSAWERVRHVELPLATPVIMSGIRLATVYLVGWATLAAFIGGGGLGDFIFNGLNHYQPEFIIAGAIPVTLMALLFEFILSKLEKSITPKGLRNLTA